MCVGLCQHYIQQMLYLGSSCYRKLQKGVFGLCTKDKATANTRHLVGAEGSCISQGSWVPTELIYQQNLKTLYPNLENLQKTKQERYISGSIFKSKSNVLAIPGFFSYFCGNPQANNSIQCNLVPKQKALLGDKRKK